MNHFVVRMMDFGKGFFKQLDPDFRLVVWAICEHGEAFVAWQLVINIYFLLLSIDK
jgi:hypothetical protein